MSRDTESIERDIERAREQLASTLDELTVRANPRRVLDNAKEKAIAKSEEPEVRIAVVGVGVLFVFVVLWRIFR
ncbi:MULTISPECIES: DUF3618 domain-containing protein [Hoyosella]|uniref:DUF3618 domain-containing protein n=2 Tax=Hoyosella TaxID=697025 RepID=F6ES49_HOYSD|nr:MULTISPECIES: DUF3618 domain-containing protein [Hoyosella]AEF42053.1 hypothetical protein AS9A_3615 [Hoyosella subflava DQS3-9A1]MBB3035824.1 uncharacterized protein (UPF0147 family) [Hoyosella altamirensis]